MYSAVGIDISGRHGNNVRCSASQVGATTRRALEGCSPRARERGNWMMQGSGRRVLQGLVPAVALVASLGLPGAAPPAYAALPTSGGAALPAIGAPSERAALDGVLAQATT